MANASPEQDLIDGFVAVLEQADDDTVVNTPLLEARDVFAQ